MKSLIADGWTNSRGWSGDLVFSVGHSLIIFELAFELLLELADGLGARLRKEHSTL